GPGLQLRHVDIISHPRKIARITGRSRRHADRGQITAAVVLVAVDSSSWLLKGLVRDGQHPRGLVGSEFDRVDPHQPTPQPIEVLFHSPVVCGGTATYADAAYYKAASGAGVFDSGTSTFVCALQPGGCADAAASQALTGIVTRLLTAFAVGPAGQAHLARDNLSLLRISRPPTPTIHSG
ncbi:MAG: N,N-dimethylformamidase beta subunit family domain-containing protein, partial [Mycobacterium leprae]